MVFNDGDFARLHAGALNSALVQLGIGLAGSDIVGGEQEIEVADDTRAV